MFLLSHCSSRAGIVTPLNTEPVIWVTEAPALIILLILQKSLGQLGRAELPPAAPARDLQAFQKIPANSHNFMGITFFETFSA